MPCGGNCDNGTNCLLYRFCDKGQIDMGQPVGGALDKLMVGVCSSLIDISGAPIYDCASRLTGIVLCYVNDLNSGIVDKY